jgi:hypothetical protein
VLWSVGLVLLVLPSSVASWFGLKDVISVNRGLISLITLTAFVVWLVVIIPKAVSNLKRMADKQREWKRTVGLLKKLRPDERFALSYFFTFDTQTFCVRYDEFDLRRLVENDILRDITSITESVHNIRRYVIVNHVFNYIKQNSRTLFPELFEAQPNEEILMHLRYLNEQSLSAERRLW